MKRVPRLALMTLPTLDHFTSDIIERLPAAAGLEIRKFMVTKPAVLNEALAWLDDPAQDSIWFEFCWPPFPAMIEATEFGGRRVIVRVHGIEAKEAPHVAYTAWAKVNDLIVVSDDMAMRVTGHAPEIHITTNLHMIPNGTDTHRFAPSKEWKPYNIGWCGMMTARKNPMLALHILHDLLQYENRYTLRMCGKASDPMTAEMFAFLRSKLGLDKAVQWHGSLSQMDMPEWHKQNGILLHTSFHESYCYSISEAALCGCDLVVYDHPGANSQWPEDRLFSSINEAVKLIRSSKPNRWRKHVIERFSIERQIKNLTKLLSTRRKFESLLPEI